MGKKSGQNLGKALIRRQRAPIVTGRSTRHTTEIHDDPGKSAIQSITEQSALSEFISTAALANREFTAERSNTTIVTPSHVPGVLSKQELEEIKIYQDENKELLNIPRRPPWDTSMTAGQLENAENESFLQWRRQLALLDEKDDKLVLTPYEKNIDVWRQLWRVIERSDVLCQIVDARNPLLFKCDDLEKYVKEISKEKDNIIIINKADYLSEKQRKYWAEYFKSRNITVIFWSALIASTTENDEREASKMETSMTPENDFNEKREDVEVDKDEGVGFSEEEEKQVEEEEQVEEEKEKDEEEEMKEHGQCGHEKMDLEEDESLRMEQSCQFVEDTASAEMKEEINHRNNEYSLLSRNELIKYFEDLKIRKCPTKERVVIGMVGFPNVGKSSTINALLGDKKTSVSSTPGKTKHFQTININENICLCDCPGLVFPTFVSTKAEMILNGILPVDQMRDYRPPSTLLCQLIPRQILESLYGINIPAPGEGEDPQRSPTADEFLSAYSSMRGFMTSHGMPDCSRGARHVIKDFLSGKLLYCDPPPEISKVDFAPASMPLKKWHDGKSREGIRKPPIKMQSDIDREFFTQRDSGIHYNAPAGVRPMSEERNGQEGKPWKKHFNRNKKEKLRRMKNN